MCHKTPYIFVKMVTNIQATRLTLEQRQYHLRELQELAISCNLDIGAVKQSVPWDVVLQQIVAQTFPHKALNMFLPVG
jgi:hypothetical protein